MNKESNYKIIADYSFDWETWEDYDGNLKYVSPSCMYISGYSSDEFLEDPGLFEALIIEDDLGFWRNYRYNIKNDEIYNNEDISKIQFRILHKNGHIVWIEHICMKIIDQDRNIIGIRAKNRDITQSKEVEESLRDSEEKYKLLFENATESIVLVQNGRIILSNEMATILMGYSSEELPKHHFLKYIHPDDADLVYSNHKKRIQGEPVDRIYTFRLLRKDDTIRWIEMNSLKILWEGQPATFNLLSDITEKKLAQDALKVSEEKYRLLFENAVEAILVIQDSNIKICNPMASSLTAYSLDELKNMKFTDFVYEEDVERALDFHKKRLKGISQGTKQQFRIVRKDNEIRWIESDGIIIDWNGKKASLQFAMDITDRKSKEEKILYLSFYDQLTGLYNRRFYEEELKRLNTARNLPLTLIMADVNGLKLTNDAFGHIVGDKLLKEVGTAMKKELRVDDILARIGGDEFVILLPKTDKLDAKMIVQRIKDRISEISIDKISASVSFGHETKYDEEDNIEKVFARAENYMYRRKLLESASMKNEMITLITRSLHERDKNEQLHSERVAKLCKLIAEAMNLEGYVVAEMFLLGMLHDIGKIGLNHELLCSHTPISEKDLHEIRKHPETGYHILKSVSEFSHIAEYVLCHHERPDGKGYPRGLRAEDLPLQAKILSIAEAYDSMVNTHYKKAISQSDAISELIANSGKQFDKEVVDVFIERLIQDEEITK